MAAKRITVLSGAGLSKASGIPTFRDAEGLWEGHDPMAVATPEAWHADRDLVRRFYDARRLQRAACVPNPGHDALAELQRRLGVERVALVTQNIDGMLEEAGAPQVLDMHGSLHRLRCEASEDHPTVPVADAQDPLATCEVCDAPLRPDVVWFGEIPRYMAEIQFVVASCDLFVSVGTSGLVYPAAGLVDLARRAGARTVEINPVPSGSDAFHVVIAEPSEIALPRLVARWIAD